jgi:uncharacterized protein (TIGR03437 family)
LVAAGDFKGDGKPGLVGPATNERQLSILINETPGSDASANALSAADFSFFVAPGSIASLFGSGLASGTGQATGPPLPTSLANTSVRVLDANGVERLAGLLYVSPTQINFVIPPETAPYGPAIFNVAGPQTLPDGARSTIVQHLAPAFFTLSGAGQGPPAATAVRAQADGSQTPVPVAQCSAAGACTLIPIDVSTGNVYLSLYGTGFRGVAPGMPSGGTVDAKCGSPVSNSNPVVTYVGPQPTTLGLDQLNLLLPSGLPSGIVTIECQFTFLPFPTPMVPTIYYGSASFSIAIQ